MTKQLSPSKRAAVFQKTAGACAYCGTAIDFDGFVVDHVLPRMSGGKNGLDNLLPCCSFCNASKGRKSLQDFRLFCAAKEVTATQLFGQAQLEYLFKAGAFPVLGFNPDYRFHFEKACAGGAV